MVWSDITSLWGGQDTGTADVTLAHCLALALTPDPDPRERFWPLHDSDPSCAHKTPRMGSLRVWEFTEVLLTEQEIGVS